MSEQKRYGWTIAAWGKTGPLHFYSHATIAEAWAHYSHMRTEGSPSRVGYCHCLATEKEVAAMAKRRGEFCVIHLAA